MNFSFSYRIRFTILVFLSLIVFYLAWVFALKKTIHLVRENEMLKNQINLAASSDLREDELKRLIDKYDFGRATYSQQEVLDSITKFTKEHDLLITDFQSIQQKKENDIILSYQPIEIQGSYQSILRLVYYIEHERQLRAVNHLKLFIYENKRKKTKNLRAKFYLLDVIK